MQTAKHFLQYLGSALWSRPMLLASAVICLRHQGQFCFISLFFSAQAGAPLTTFLYAISNKSSFGGKGRFSFTYLQRCSCFCNEWFNKEMC